MTAPRFPRFRPVSDHAVQVEFAETITPQAHEAVLRLDRLLAKAGVAGFTEAVPAYVSLLVCFDPVVTDHIAVEGALRGVLGGADAARLTAVLHQVSVCYEDDFSPDLAQVSAMVGLSPEAVIAAHLAGDYSVFMYGFAPGYAYLAGVPQALQLPRKPAAVRGISAGSVIIAGPQCLVTTLTMPTGWWIIGRSPCQILRDDPVRPFLFDVGDRVQFRRISRAEFAAEGGS